MHLHQILCNFSTITEAELESWKPTVLERCTLSGHAVCMLYIYHLKNIMKHCFVLLA